MIIKRLSHRKILVERNIEIYCGTKKIGETTVKCRYKYGTDYPDPVYLPMRDVFYNQLSHKYRLKKKFISVRTKAINVPFEDTTIVLRNCPDFISFDNIQWFTTYNRDRILNNLLV